MTTDVDNFSPFEIEECAGFHRKDGQDSRHELVWKAGDRGQRVPFCLQQGDLSVVPGDLVVKLLS